MSGGYCLGGYCLGGYSPGGGGGGGYCPRSSQMACAYGMCLRVLVNLPAFYFTCLQGHPAAVVCNLAFGVLSVFHLAYLGLMFDSSSQEEEVRFHLTHSRMKRYESFYDNLRIINPLTLRA